MKILVAEDTQHIALALKARLTSMGWEVLLAHDGQTALDMILLERPHLLIMDIYMPRMSGHMVLERLRAEPDIHGLPVIFLTAYATAPNEAQAEKNGVFAVLPKPFDPELLIATVQRALESRGA